MEESKKELQELLNIIDDKIDIGLESINALNLGENIINLDDELADYYRDLKSGVDQATEIIYNCHRKLQRALR